ncbi:MAG: DUF3717 domain-containing protein [Burkholderiaceae bacterium]
MDIISITDLELAINRARQTEPSVGHEAALSSDVSLLADLYGELIFRGHRAFKADSVTLDHQKALARWVVDSAPKAA